MMNCIDMAAGRLENRWLHSTKHKRVMLYWLAYTAAFLAAFLIAYSPILLHSISFVNPGDGRWQHYPILVAMGRSIRKVVLNLIKGNFSIPLFNIASNMGEDIIGVMHTNGGLDPLAILSGAVPARDGEYLYAVLDIFHLYLAGLSFSFLCFYFGRRKIFTLIGSLVYCFSGYAIHYTMDHPYFINPMIQLPMFIVGTDKVLKKDGSLTLIFAIFYSSLCGYYHLYMMSVATVIYAVIRFFDLYHEKRGKELICAAARGVICFCLGVGLSAVVFLPSVMYYLNSCRSGYSHYQGAYDLSYYRYTILRLISPPGRDRDLTLAAVVLPAIAVTMTKKDKRTIKVLVVIAFAFLLTSTGGLIMNGFQYSSNRWTFMIALVTAFVVVDGMGELLELSRGKRLLCASVLCVYSLAAVMTAEARTTDYVLVGTTFLALTMFVLTMPVGGDGISKHLRSILRSGVLIVLVIMNVGINGIYKYANDQGNGISDYLEFNEEKEYLESIPERDVEPYLLNNPAGRVDSSRSTQNTGLVWNIPNLIIYNSAANKDLIDFWQQIEVSGNSQIFHFYTSDQKMIANTLLSVKYQVETGRDKSYVPYGYELIKHAKSGRDIYENQYALPWGYTYDTVISYDDLNGLNGIQKQEAMLQAVALDDMGAASQFESVQFDEYALPYSVKCDSCTWENGILDVKDDNAKITLNFKMAAGVEGYIRYNGLDIDGSGIKGFNVVTRCGDVAKKSRTASELYTWYYGRKVFLHSLGYSDEVRTELTITFPNKGIFKLDNIELYALPMDNYPERVEALREEPLENIQWGTNSLTGTVDLSKDKILCVSVPYSKGWTATVDGEEVEILRGNYMFMCLPLTAGHHDIEFHYCSPGIKLGAVVTVCSAGIVIWMLIHDRKKKGTVK